MHTADFHTQFCEDDIVETATANCVISAEEVVEARSIHPDAKVLFNACPWTRYIPVFGQSMEAFGPKCTFSLGMCYFLCKGIADQTIQLGLYAMMRSRFGISGERYQRLSPIATMGWSMKALIAMLCDAFAFCGYTKRWYMLIACLVGSAFALAYGLLPAKPSSADTAAAFIFMTCFTKACVDILSEGHYSRLMRRNPVAGPSLISSIWWFIMLGAMVAASIMGPMSDRNLPQVGIFVSAALQLVTGIIFAFNWYGEKQNRVARAEDHALLQEELRKERGALGLAPEELEDHPDADVGGHAKTLSIEDEKARNRIDELMVGERYDEMALHDELDPDHVDPFATLAELRSPAVEPIDASAPLPLCCGVFEYNREVTQRNWRVFVYSIIMTCAVVSMTCGNILADTLGLLIICVSASVICCGFSFWALPMVIAKANVFCFLQSMVYIKIPGALDSFYLATPDCVADGPHFSFTFYNTIAQVIGNCAGLVGVWCFNYIFSNRNYQVTYIIVTLIQVIAGVFDIIIVKRWNIDIGIPDHAMYICGDAVIGQVCYMLGFMPAVVLVSRLVSRGSEAVVYALLAGFSNLGQSMAASLGSVLMEYGFPVKTEAPNCDFSNLPWLLFIVHICTPLLVIPLSFLLIPRARIRGDLDVDGGIIKKELVDESIAAAGERSRAAEPFNGENLPSGDDQHSGGTDVGTG